MLVELLSLLPTLRVVLLQGRDAVASWRRVVKKAPKLVADGRLIVVECIHPSRQALRTPDLVSHHRFRDQVRSWGLGHPDPGAGAGALTTVPSQAVWSIKCSAPGQ